VLQPFEVLSTTQDVILTTAFGVKLADLVLSLTGLKLGLPLLEDTNGLEPCQLPMAGINTHTNGINSNITSAKLCDSRILLIKIVKDFKKLTQSNLKYI